MASPIHDNILFLFLLAPLRQRSNEISSTWGVTPTYRISWAWIPLAGLYLILTHSHNTNSHEKSGGQKNVKVISRRVILTRAYS